MNKIIRYFLFTVFLLYYGCITLFTHSHHIENGIVIVHSHPFRSGTGSKPFQHQHTSEGFVLINFITTFLRNTIIAGITAAVIILVFRVIKLNTGEPRLTDSPAFLPYGLRAPPIRYTAGRR